MEDVEVPYGGTGGWDSTGEWYLLVLIPGDLEVGILRYGKQTENSTIKKKINQHGKETVCFLQAGHIFVWSSQEKKNKGLLITHTQISLVFWRIDYLGKTAEAHAEHRNKGTSFSQIEGEIFKSL